MELRAFQVALETYITQDVSEGSTGAIYCMTHKWSGMGLQGVTKACVRALHVQLS